MRELRLKYIINMVSDIKSRAKDDQQALTMAQEAVQKAFARTELQIGVGDAHTGRFGRRRSLGQHVVRSGSRCVGGQIFEGRGGG